MKERLDKESIDALILYRLQRSEETIKEAELLCDKNFYNASVNRLYYACYYAISALFLKDGIEAYSHKGMKTLFGLYYVIYITLNYCTNKLLSLSHNFKSNIHYGTKSKTITQLHHRTNKGVH